MSDDFTDVLKVQSEAVKPPQALPAGTYLGIVDGQPEFERLGAKQSRCVTFSLKFMQAQPDVNATALMEALDGKSLPDRKIRHRIFIPEDNNPWRVNQFLVNHLGIDNKGKDILQMIPEAMGRQVMITLGHRSSDDGTQIFNEIKGTAHV